MLPSPSFSSCTYKPAVQIFLFPDPFPGIPGSPSFPVALRYPLQYLLDERSSLLLSPNRFHFFFIAPIILLTFRELLLENALALFTEKYA